MNFRHLRTFVIVADHGGFSRASARLIVCTGPRPMTRSRPSSLNRKTQDFAPLALTCKNRPPPSPKSPRRFACRTERVVSFPISRALGRVSKMSAEPILPIPVPIPEMRTIEDDGEWYKTDRLLIPFVSVDFSVRCHSRSSELGGHPLRHHYAKPT